MSRSSTSVLAESDMLLDIMAFAICAMPFIIVVLPLSTFPEPIGYIAILYTVVAVLLLGQFAYGLLHQRSLMPKLIARANMVFFLFVIAAWSLRNGDYVMSSLCAVFALWVGWFTYRQSGKTGHVKGVES